MFYVLFSVSVFRALKLGQAQDFQMSADNPLKGVLFDKTFLKEKDEKSGKLLINTFEKIYSISIGSKYPCIICFYCVLDEITN